MTAGANELRVSETLAPGKGKSIRTLAYAGGEKVDEAGVLRKVNRHLLTRFILLTILCYLVRNPELRAL